MNDNQMIGELEIKDPADGETLKRHYRRIEPRVLSSRSPCAVGPIDLVEVVP